MTDLQLIERLIARDERVTLQFFYKDCRPLFMSVIHNIFHDKVDYDELISELYIHLMENDAYRLRQYQGRSTIYQWMKVVAIRYFIAKRDSMIDMAPKNSLSDSVVQRERVDVERSMMAKMDVEYLLSRMPNRRYAYVIRRLVLQEADPMVVAQELETNVDNLYNIKKRAIAALTEVALKEVEKYEKGVIK
jgi:RNA polymerase sigma factor (sigma-70 family)